MGFVVNRMENDCGVLKVRLFSLPTKMAVLFALSYCPESLYLPAMCRKSLLKNPDGPKNRQSGSAAWLDYEVLSAGISAPLFDTDENN